MHATGLHAVTMTIITTIANDAQPDTWKLFAYHAQCESPESSEMPLRHLMHVLTSYMARGFRDVPEAP